MEGRRWQVVVARIEKNHSPLSTLDIQVWKGVKHEEAIQDESFEGGIEEKEC
ncbi:MAG: hypothetical protein QME90_06730 [Thermodesulfobacteriota bacterium]|nr:hypothetical protein [Thermodesulfobacteriota bacterium]